MTPWRSVLRELQPYEPGEQPQDGRFIKLNTNENPYPPSPRVLDAIRAAATADIRLYPDPSASELRRAAARQFGLDPDEVLVGNGSDELLAMLMRACVGRGDRVAYPVPTYSLYDTLVAVQEGVAVRIPFPADFSLPPGLKSAEASLTIVCNPNSPTGTHVPAAELGRLAQEVSGLLVIDEAYADFADGNALALVREHPNIVVLRTLSKSYSLAGMRIGLAFARPPIIGQLRKVKDSYNVSRVAIAAGVAALEDQHWMRANAEKIRRSRARLAASLRALGYSVPESQANFVLARRPGVNQEPVYRALKQRGILVRYFPAPDLCDALRITVGTDAEIEALLAALREIL